jgi:hypothetical protein
MKNLIRLSVLALIAFIGCAPDAPTFVEYSNPNAQYEHNVSALYGKVSSTNSLGFDIKWRDSTGQVHKMSDLQGVKTVLIGFGKTSNLSSDTLYHQVDSVRALMGDSVFTLIIAKDNTGFRTVANFVSAQGIKSQVISDSTSTVQLEFVQHSDGIIYTPQTFIIGTDGKVVTNTPLAGPMPVDTLRSWVRKAYTK